MRESGKEATGVAHGMKEIGLTHRQQQLGAEAHSLNINRGRAVRRGSKEGQYEGQYEQRRLPDLRAIVQYGAPYQVRRTAVPDE